MKHLQYVQDRPNRTSDVLRHTTGPANPRVTDMRAKRGMIVRSVLVTLCIVGGGWTQFHHDRLPQFEDYPVAEKFTGSPALPILRTPLQRRVGKEIGEGILKGYGVFRDSREQPGPNFAGKMIIIQWACGAPCKRMAVTDARSGEVYYPPISVSGIGVESFDLPLLTVDTLYPQNPEIQFRLDSRLLTVVASLPRRPAYRYYFLWREDRWKLLVKTPLRN